MAYYSVVEATGTGAPQLVSTPPYLDKTHIYAYADAAQITFFEWVNSNTIRLTAPAQSRIRVVRSTSPHARLSNYQGGSSLPADLLNLDSKQAFYLAQEGLDRSALITAGGYVPNPGGGGPGYVPTTEELLGRLTGAITSSQLATALGTRINLIDGPESLAGSTNARLKSVRDDVNVQVAAALASANGTTAAAVASESATRTTAIAAEASSRNLLAAQLRGSYTGTDPAGLSSGILYNERVARANADLSLANQITLLSAGVGEQFDYRDIWYFDSGSEDWTGEVGNPVAYDSFLRPLPGSGWVQGMFHEPVTIAGFNQLKFRVRKVGTPTWAAYYGLAASDGSVAATTGIPAPTFVDGLAVVTVDMTETAEYHGIRLELCDASDGSNYFELDWVAVGRSAPGASSAALFEEQTARATQIDAEAAQRQLLSATLLGTPDPADMTLDAVTSGILFEEKQARADGDGALASDITALSAGIDGVSASLAAEASVRASETGALFGQWTVKLDLNGYVSGFGLASTAGTASPTSQFLVRADSFAIASPTGPGIPAKAPFAVQTVAGYIDGVYVPAGVYIDGATINRINAAQIDTRGLTIKDALGNVVFAAGTGLDLSRVNGRGAFAGLSQITAANVSTYIQAAAIGNAQIGGNIYSDNYVAGVSGWIIRKADGYAEFGNVKVRGDVQATSLTGNIVNTSHVQAGAINNFGAVAVEGLQSNNPVLTVALLNCIGAPVTLRFECDRKLTDSGNGNAVITIARNGVVLLSRTMASDSTMRSMSAVVVDSGVVGNATYTAQVYYSSGTSVAQTQRSSFIAHELRR